MGAAAPPSMRDRVMRIVRAIALTAVGLGLAGWLVKSAGTSLVLRVLGGAGAWLPLLVTLELGLVACDVLATRSILGPAAAVVPVGTWVRSSALSYAAMIFLPGGRAASEATRAATLARAVGPMRAAHAAIVMQGCALLANVIASSVSYVVIGVRLSFRDPLAFAILGNAAVCALLGGIFLGLAQSRRVVVFLRERVPFLRAAGEDPDHAESKTLAHALPWIVLARTIQTIQFGVGLAAIGAATSAGLALVAQGVQLVGSAVGDLIPNQMGATEAASRIFAGPLGLAHEPARAVAFALVIRLVQVGVGLCAIFIGSSVRAPEGAAVVVGSGESLADSTGDSLRR